MTTKLAGKNTYFLPFNQEMKSGKNKDLITSIQKTLAEVLWDKARA